MTTSKGGDIKAIGNKVTEKTKKKRLAVLDCALACFTEHGVEATTIEMIRDASGMSVGSLYHHFGNKEKIASALYLEGTRSFGRVVKARITELLTNPEAVDLEALVRAIVYANVDWISEQPDWARFVFHHRSMVDDTEEGTTLQRDFSVFNQALDSWVEKLGAQKLQQLDRALLSALISGPTHNYARQWLAGRVSTPLEAHREVLADAAWQSAQGILV
jgi:AcrR family transcriptional regulator